MDVHERIAVSGARETFPPASSSLASQLGDQVRVKRGIQSRDQLLGHEI
jgi:hypothetical protein